MRHLRRQILRCAVNACPGDPHANHQRLGLRALGKDRADLLACDSVANAGAAFRAIHLHGDSGKRARELDHKEDLLVHRPSVRGAHAAHPRAALNLQIRRIHLAPNAVHQVQHQPAPRLRRQRRITIPVHAAARGRRQLRVHIRRVQMHRVVSRPRGLALMREGRAVAAFCLVKHPAGISAQRFHLRFRLLARSAGVPAPVTSFHQRHQQHIAQV